MPDGRLPYSRYGVYGRAALDRSACGRGFVVHYTPSTWVRDKWGNTERWATFEQFHTALAFYFALTGAKEVARELIQQAAPRHRLSKWAQQISGERPGRASVPEGLTRS